MKNCTNLIMPNLKKPEETITLFPRIINSTHIIFTEDETDLLTKGLKYNLKYKPKIGSKHYR
jgi:thiamine pyrophosphokinase